ncbi:YbaB/EbfC DNA-binding family protein [Herbihabitans rhizosphaerae]|uniref:YbaB/EbfC DNA-binding family protein n=1 Tax=Herbihabitans rhizosphaerae TaxID=1872711 RepID=A0A4Q7KCU1_9PSEU|nr:YbaB/EbfC family nucleoid-associated protein [Herbihabitans rhizosphaerae]RZS30506.1 YbaB/EbfC DNA-binding family protein [Herbihabitans rhizosphaerae]
MAGDEIEDLLQELEGLRQHLPEVPADPQRLTGLREQLAELRATAVSPDGGVRVVAGPGGSIIDIQVTDTALKKGAAALSSTIMVTLRNAVAQSARDQAMLVEEVTGRNTGVLDEVLQTQAEALGVSVEELRADHDERQAGGLQAGEVVEEDLGERGVLRTRPRHDPSAEAPPSPPPPLSRPARRQRPVEVDEVEDFSEHDPLRKRRT